MKTPHNGVKTLSAVALFALAAFVGCQSKSQKDENFRKDLQDSVEKTFRDESVARIEYAHQLQEYLPSAEAAVLDISTRSTKNKYITNLNDIFLVQVNSRNARMKAVSEDMLDLADAAKLKKLKFTWFLVGSSDNLTYRAYDVDKGEWLTTGVHFCRPADECTIYQEKSGGSN